MSCNLHWSLNVIDQLHALLRGSKNVSTFSGHDTCEKIWKYIFVISKLTFYINRLEFNCGMSPHDHKNLNMKHNRVYVQQATIFDFIGRKTDKKIISFCSKVPLVLTVFRALLMERCTT